MSRLNKDIISGTILLVFALSLHLLIIPAQVQSMNEGPIALSPSLFCHITAFLLLVLALGLVISGFRAGSPSKSADQENITYAVFRGVTAVLLCVCYVAAMEPVGYFTSTIAFMAVFLWFSGVKSWKGGVLFLTAVLPFIYLLFVKALKVILPTGLMM